MKTIKKYMITKIKIVMIGITAIMLIPNVAFASVGKELTEEEHNSGFYNDDGSPIQTDRPVINPIFDPDEDCNFAYELHCIPGSQQDCPEGFHNGEDNVCSPVDCPNGYVGADDDETGLCITYEECESYDNYRLIETDDGGKRCAALYYICDTDEHMNQDYCREYNNSVARS